MNDPLVLDLCARMIAFGNKYGDREYWHGMAKLIATMHRDIQSYKKGHERYELVRTLNAKQFTEMFKLNVEGKARFDDLVDIEILMRKNENS
jgi:hypothetical protein